MMRPSKTTWWISNAALCLGSAVFILPFLWLVLTALKPIEQTMKFQWLPKGYQATIDGQTMQVIKERPISEESVIAVLDQGPRKGEKVLLEKKNFAAGRARIEEQTADQVKTVWRKATELLEVPKGWWLVREKLLRKYAERQPRWTCVAPGQIKEGVRLWWENFVLAIEYLADTRETPLRFDSRKTPPGAAAEQQSTKQYLCLLWPNGGRLDAGRYDTLRVRVQTSGTTNLQCRVAWEDGSSSSIGPPIEIEAGQQDVDFPLGRELRPSRQGPSYRIAGLWLEPTASAGDAIQLSEGMLIQYRATFWTYLANTLIVCLLGCLGTVLSSSLVAYGFSRIQWPGRDKLFWLVLATMMIPFPVTMVPLFSVFRELHWVGTLKPLWVPAFFSSAFNIFLLRQFFLTIPHDLSDAARIDGCSEFGIYWRIMLPLAKPALAVVALFYFLFAWNDFMGPLIYLTRPETFTLSIALQFYQSQHGGSEWHLLMAMSVLILLPIVLLFFFTQKTFIQGIATTGMKG